MVIGKLKYLEPAVEHIPHCLVFGHARVQGTLGRWACFMPGEKGEKSRGWLGPHACELDLPCKVNKFDSNRPTLTDIGTV